VSPTHRWNRREWLASVGFAAGISLLPDGIRASVDFAGSDSSESAAANGIADKVAPKVQPFALSQVRLKSGPFLEATNTNLRYLHSLLNDSLLHSFRLTAGIPSHAEPFGGWESPNGELRGHYTGGHYLSACALRA